MYRCRQIAILSLDRVKLALCPKQYCVMSTSPASGREVLKQKKYRAACDQCHASKVRCPGGGPPCKRCSHLDKSALCHYSLAARIGKPPGSKNRKTLERIRLAEMERLGNSCVSSEEAGWTTLQHDQNSTLDNGSSVAESRHLRGEICLDSLQTPHTTISQPISTPITDLHPFDLPRASSSRAHEHFAVSTRGVLDNDGGSSCGNSEQLAINVAGLQLPDSWDLEKADSAMVWSNMPGSSWNVRASDSQAQSNSQETQLPSPDLSQYSSSERTGHGRRFPSKLAGHETDNTKIRRCPFTRHFLNWM